MAEHYHSSKPQGGRGSPTKAEFDFIKRMVDDGQPVVLGKKLKKALKIKDDMDTLDKAMKDDLKSAGYTKEEIDGGVDEDQSEEDSAERRKRKALKEAKGPNYVPTKRISKKERTRLAYQAERDRQKLLKPKTAPQTAAATIGQH